MTTSTTIPLPTTTSTTMTIYPIKVPVLVLSYFPDEDNDGRLDSSITGIDEDINVMKDKVQSLTVELINALNTGSTYHAYKKPSAPSLNYFVFESKEFIKPLPLSDFEVPWNPGIYRPDYFKILSEIDICDYVDNKGVKEVWIWGYHYGKIEPVESDMAMGYVSRNFWNHGSYGDVSNSEQTNDLPVCDNTYTLFNYNYGRGLAEAIESHTHQIEAVLKYVDYELFWNKFVNPYGQPKPNRNHCGWTHYPPNGVHDYDWWNTNIVLSDCENWKPDNSGEVEEVNCATWYSKYYGTSECKDDGGIAFKIWWMQNIPGKDNELYDNGKKLRNWWEFIGDFDDAIQKGKSLKE
jgi:hypothetical protein